MPTLQRLEISNGPKETATFGSLNASFHRIVNFLTPQVGCFKARLRPMIFKLKSAMYMCNI